LFEPFRALSIGLALQPPSKYDAHGQGELDFTGHALETYLSKNVWTDDDIGLVLQMPLIIRTGVAVRPTDRLELEGDFIWEGWHSLKDIEVTDIDITITSTEDSPIAINQQVEDTISLPAGFDDAFSVRLGAEYRVSHMIELRSGGFYESSALKPQSVSVALVDAPKIMGSVGTSVHLLQDRLILDAYGAAIRYQPLHIEDSKVTQINVYGGTEGVVGNGEIDSAGYSFGAAARWQFMKRQVD
jgi:long-subunit fatty acid transport protein